MNRNLSILRGPLSIAVLAVAVSACGSATPSVAPTPTIAPTAHGSDLPSPSGPSAPVASPSPSAGQEALTAHSWRLVRLTGVDLPPEAGITATFEPAGNVGGSGGCNEYGGNYSSDGSEISIGDVMSTLIGCDGVVGQREGAFFAALEAVETWSIVDERLTLAGLDGEELLVFE